ncbi:hypothetical protein GCM10027286_13140 [Virgibacillus ainsalahensis]
MTRLIPFNKRVRGLSRDGPGNFINMVGDFFHDPWFTNRNPMI